MGHDSHYVDSYFCNYVLIVMFTVLIILLYYAYS